jgi:hypothetical protein
MALKYVDTQPIVVDAVRWNGHNTGEVAAIGLNESSTLEVGAWIVRRDGLVAVFSPEEFATRFTPVGDLGHPDQAAAAVVADALAFEGGMD